MLITQRRSGALHHLRYSINIKKHKKAKKNWVLKLLYVSIEVHSRQTCKTLEFQISNNGIKFTKKKTKPKIFEQTQVKPKKNV